MKCLIRQMGQAARHIYYSRVKVSMVRSLKIFMSALVRFSSVQRSPGVAGGHGSVTTGPFGINCRAVRASFGPLTHLCSTERLS
jgi:hypothetical protein